MASRSHREQTLTNKQIHAIAEAWYRDLVWEHEDDPGDVEQWVLYQDLLSDAADEDNRSRAAHRLSKLIRIDPWLEARGYNLDQETREKVLLAVSAALFSGADTIKRRAGGGDYGPDEKLRSYPVSKRNASSNELRGGGGIRLADLFEGWAKEVAPAHKTVCQRRRDTSIVTRYGLSARVQHSRCKFARACSRCRCALQTRLEGNSRSMAAPTSAAHDQLIGPSPTLPGIFFVLSRDEDPEGTARRFSSWFNGWS